MSSGSAIVVGAGAAGIHAARSLMRAGVQVTLLEASDRAGGRVRALEGFGREHVELGAEEVHGQRSRTHRLAVERGVKLRQCRERRVLFGDRAAVRAADMRGVRRFFRELRRYRGPDVPLSRELAALPARTRALLSAMLGNEYGASSERLGMLALARAEAAWEGEGGWNFTSEAPMLEVIGAGDVPVRLSQPVTRVRWGGRGVEVFARERFTAERAVIAVPLPLLRELTFEPPLPPAQAAAARGIATGAILKVLIRFRDRLPAGLTLIGGRDAPQMWASGRHVLTAFLCGAAAERWLERGTRKALPRLLRALAQAGLPRVVEDCFVQDWSAEPFIRCGYSYPNAGSADLRRVLAAPLASSGRTRVAFAGEATHETLFGSLQGALLSAERAVAEVLAA